MSLYSAFYVTVSAFYVRLQQSRQDKEIKHGGPRSCFARVRAKHERAFAVFVNTTFERGRVSGMNEPLLSQQMPQAEPMPAMHNDGTSDVIVRD